MPLLKIIIDFIKWPDKYVSKSTIFVLKCLVITMCLSHLLSSYMPKYEFLDPTHRYNTVTGKTEHKVGDYFTKHWEE